MRIYEKATMKNENERLKVKILKIPVGYRTVFSWLTTLNTIRTQNDGYVRMKHTPEENSKLNGLNKV